MNRDERDTIVVMRDSEGETLSPKRVIAVDLENEEVVVVPELDYHDRRFDRATRVSFANALWVP